MLANVAVRAPFGNKKRVGLEFTLSEATPARAKQSQAGVMCK